ncbi:hypothetical protein CEP54_014382 [Fusarium duplospermum]|uniref:Uncharacterized protein n=1 Tax=Fusarium duplospermum TaxID=1325734 RepID=A0A428NWQ9_9HYPO|nr:hypothetical protein CEP54_014382 [Fusarium duplospermum]
MDSDKKQTQTNQTVSGQTGSKSDNGKADARKQTDGKINNHLPPGNYAQVMPVAKVALKNRRSEADLQRRRATISRELEKTNKLLDEVRSRIKDVPEFDEDDLAGYRAVLEARARDLAAKSAISDAEEDEDEEYEDCEGEDSEDDEDDGVSICLKARPESLHDDSSTFDDTEAAEETNSNLDANSDEDSDSDDGVNLTEGKGIKADHSLNDECF